MVLAAVKLALKPALLRLACLFRDGLRLMPAEKLELRLDRLFSFEEDEADAILLLLMDFMLACLARPGRLLLPTPEG